MLAYVFEKHVPMLGVRQKHGLCFAGKPIVSSIIEILPSSLYMYLTAIVFHKKNSA